MDCWLAETGTVTVHVAAANDDDTAGVVVVVVAVAGDDVSRSQSDASAYWLTLYCSLAVLVHVVLAARTSIACSIHCLVGCDYCCWCCVVLAVGLVL